MTTRAGPTPARCRFFAWCEQRGLHAHGHPAVRCCGLGKGTGGETRGAGCEAAACRCAHAVRLAGHRPGSADEPGRRGARTEARRENRQDAGARRCRVAQALDSIPTETVRDLRDRALIATLTYSFARIGAALRMKVEDLRPKAWLANPGIKRRKAACDAVPSRARRGATRLHRCCRHRRRPQKLALSQAI